MFRSYLKIAGAAVPLLIMFGCGLHSPKITDPLPANQIRATFQAVFKSADAATRDAANKIADELDQHQLTAASADLNELMSSQSLSKEQAVDLVRANNTVTEMLRQAAQTGDQEAAATVQVIHHH